LGLLKKTFWFEATFEVNLDDLHEYASTIEDLLKEKLEKFNAMVDKLAPNIPPEDLDDFYDSYGDDGWKLQETFPDILRKSLFLTCYSRFEHGINSLCRFFSKQTEYKLKLSDLKHEGIIKAQVYLKNVVGIEFPDQTTSWQDIKKYNLIRNYIVHNDSELNVSEKPKEAEEIRRFIEQKTTSSVDTGNKIKLSKEFSIDFINTLRVFLRELYKVLP